MFLHAIRTTFLVAARADRICYHWRGPSADADKAAALFRRALPAEMNRDHAAKKGWHTAKRSRPIFCPPARTAKWTQTSSAISMTSDPMRRRGSSALTRRLRARILPILEFFYL